MNEASTPRPLKHVKPIHVALRSQNYITKPSTRQHSNLHNHLTDLPSSNSPRRAPHYNHLFSGFTLAGHQSTLPDSNQLHIQLYASIIKISMNAKYTITYHIEVQNENGYPERKSSTFIEQNKLADVWKVGSTAILADL